MFKIEDTKVLFNGRAIYEAPRKILDSLPCKDDLIILYDPDDALIDEQPHGEGRFLRNTNIHRITSAGEKLWNIHGGSNKIGYWV